MTQTHTYEELKALPPARIREILSSPIVSMDCPSGFGEYEENHEFEGMTLTLADGTVVTGVGGYNGIDEMLCYDTLSPRKRLIVSAQFAGWLQYEALIGRWEDDELNPEGRDPEYGMTAETAKAFVEHGFFFDDVLAKMMELRDEG